MKNVVLFLTLIIFFLEWGYILNNVVIMRKKAYLDIFNLHKYKRYDKFNELDKDNNKIPLELYDEGINLNKNFMKTNIICNKKNCRIPYGECLNRGICQCLEGYASIENNHSKNSTNPFDNKFYCNYRQKNQLFAFLYEFIFIFGIGHIYLHRFYQGFSKLILFIFLSILIYLIYKYDIKPKIFLEENISNRRNLIINILMILSFCTFLLIHIFDIYMLVTNSYLDGYGIEIITWNRDLGKIITFDFLFEKIK